MTENNGYNTLEYLIYEDLKTHSNDKLTNEKKAYYLKLFELCKEDKNSILSLSESEVKDILHIIAEKAQHCRPGKVDKIVTDFVLDFWEATMRFENFEIEEAAKDIIKELFAGYSLPYKRESREGKIVKDLMYYPEEEEEKEFHETINTIADIFFQPVPKSSIERNNERAVGVKVDNVEYILKTTTDRAVWDELMGLEKIIRYSELFNQYISADDGLTGISEQDLRLILYYASRQVNLAELTKYELVKKAVKYTSNFPDMVISERVANDLYKICKEDYIEKLLKKKEKQRFIISSWQKDNRYFSKLSAEELIDFLNEESNSKLDVIISVYLGSTQMLLDLVRASRSLEDKAAEQKCLEKVTYLLAFGNLFNEDKEQRKESLSRLYDVFDGIDYNEYYDEIEELKKLMKKEFDKSNRDMARPHFLIKLLRPFTVKQFAKKHTPYTSRPIQKKSFRTFLISVAIIAVLTVSAVATDTFGIYTNVKGLIGKIVQQDNKEYSSTTNIIYYDSIDEMIKTENIDIIYPKEEISKIAVNNFSDKIYEIRYKNGLFLTIDNFNNFNFEGLELLKYDIDIYLKYFAEDNCYIAYWEYNNFYYKLSFSDKGAIIGALDSMFNK